MFHFMLCELEGLHINRKQSSMRTYLPVVTVPIELRNSLKRIPDDVSAIRTIRDSESLERSYRVNFGDMSCTCSNWLAERGQYEVNDIRRLCKHHVGVLVEYNILGPVAAQLAVGHLLPFSTKRYCMTELTSRDFKILAVRYRQGIFIDDFIDVLVPTPLGKQPL
jgi:hypothetical protein